MIQTIKAIVNNAVNLVYPMHCAGCGGALEATNELGACASCVKGIRANPKPYYRATDFCFDKAHSACLYEEPLKGLIHAFKYKNGRRLAQLFSNLMIDFIDNNPEILDNIDMITSVPLQNNRLRERGFNQSKILAEKISKEFDISYMDILFKIKSTRPQNELARSERLTNLERAFSVSDNARPDVEGRGILLIDDVMTTGATLAECAKVLKKSGAEKIDCLTLARGA